MYLPAWAMFSHNSNNIGMSMCMPKATLAGILFLFLVLQFHNVNICFSHSFIDSFRVAVEKNVS